MIFFILVNTTYYWESKLGLFAVPIVLFLVVVYFGLTVVLIRQIYFVIKEKLANKRRILLIALLTIVLVSTFYKPFFRLVNLEELEGADLLVAQREGSANCMTTLKLKEDFTFRERSVCFGVTEIKGKYRLQNDTIYFVNVELGRYEDEFYKFAIIKQSKLHNYEKHYAIIRYKSLTDTIGTELLITKNELIKLRE